jgi:SAM-dependent methyltransferase
MLADDPVQDVFHDFEVPDPSRIAKVKRWLVEQQLVGNGRAARVLELGYAKGGLLDQLGDVPNVIGDAVDLHPRTNNGIRFHQHDCNEPMTFFEDGRFDVVFAGELIEHIFDDMRFLREVRRILQPEGILALTTPNLFFLPNRALFAFGRLPMFAYASFHHHFYSVPVMTRMLLEAGYIIEHVTASHVLVSSRRHKILGPLCERLGSWMPRFGAHMIIFARKAPLHQPRPATSAPGRIVDRRCARDQRQTWLTPTPQPAVG